MASVTMRRPLAAQPFNGRVLDPQRYEAGIEQIGAKAASLLALCNDGIAVPAFFCVTTRVYDELLARLPGPLQQALAALDGDASQLTELSGQVRDAVAACGLPDGTAEELARAFEDSFPTEQLVSVRSSGVGEDSATHSFAGQFDTHLYVTKDTLAARVLDCFASAFSARALFYRQLHRLPPDTTRMAVVVQKMVDSIAAGVSFTVDPTSGRTDRVLISAGLGLGSGVVDGSVPVDTFVIAHDGTILKRSINPKSTAVTRDQGNGHGTTVTEIDSAAAALPALSDTQAQQIAAIALRLAERRCCPQDVEWALDRDGTIRVLQARPVTTRLAGRPTTFDNSNLVESYPGLTSPLTFSLMRQAYRANFLGLVRAFGAPAALVERHPDVYENLVGLLNGRMYYNLSNWYRMFELIPGMERALPAFEKAMGFKAQGGPPQSTRTLGQRLRWIPVQARVLRRLLISWARIGSRVDTYINAFEACDRDVRSVELHRLDAHELLDRVERYTRELFWPMAAAPISDFFTQQLYNLLGVLIAKWGLGDPLALRNELLCGETEMKSVEPVHSLVALSQQIRDDAAARTLFESDAGSATVWAAIETDPRLRGLSRALGEHVRHYGDRSLGELKLETVTLTDDPTDLVAILRNYLRGGKSVVAMETHERAIRSAAEATVRKELARHPLRRVMFAFVLSHCRWGLKARENIRFTRGRMAGLFRKLFRALGDRFADTGLLETPTDIFFLTESEIADAIRGASATTGLHDLVALRRREYETAACLHAPSRIEPRGIVLAGDLFEPAAPSDSHGGLVGTGCSPGRVRARAMIIDEPRTDLVINGEILVATTTDPGWVFLMVAAGGLISEQGNVLSHTAIIGRELGIPTVVGVTNATRLIPDGASIELDGGSGRVTIEPTEAQHAQG